MWEVERQWNSWNWSRKGRVTPIRPPLQATAPHCYFIAFSVKSMAAASAMRSLLALTTVCLYMADSLH